MDRYIVFDVETPNSYNDRMSAIGIAVVENGALCWSGASYINPETHFDRFNMELTGISPDLVRSSPTFPELWRRFGPLLQSGVLVAHNAAFDMRVLACCLMDYGLESLPFLPYACTVQMGRKCYPLLPDHKLNTMCDALHIPLDHHRADSDSLACASLLMKYMAQGLDVGDYLRAYDMQLMRSYQL